MRILLIFFVAALAGCVQTPDEALELNLAGVPTHAAVGEPITLAMTATDAAESTHVGAHYWTSSQSDPTAAFDAAKGCAHVPDVTTFPATVDVSCTFQDVGTVYLRGHVRVGEVNHWSDEVMIQVASYHVMSTEVPDDVVAGEPMSFHLGVHGDSGESNHVGAHWFTEMVEDPTAELANAGACDHPQTTTMLPAETTVTCTFDAPGTYYVYGHMRLGAQANFWAEPFTLVVS